MFIRFDVIHERDGRTDGHTDTAPRNERAVRPIIHCVRKETPTFVIRT